MPKLAIAGLALLEVLIVVQPAEAETILPWCRIGRHGSGRQCEWYTRDQCAASTEWQAIGTCYENPNYHGNTTPAAVPGVRSKVAAIGPAARGSGIGAPDWCPAFVIDRQRAAWRPSRPGCSVASFAVTHGRQALARRAVSRRLQ